MDPIVRWATAADIRAIAALRTRWSPPKASFADRDVDEFAGLLRDWVEDAGDRYLCAIAELDGELVGMASLVMFDRVPNPDQPRRLAGDIQSVYVEPEHRGRGLGRQLVELLIDEADRRGIAKLTADSSEEALPLYRRLGFTESPLLLQRQNPTSP